jgi:DNA-binding transcriptional LysR family regulator
MAMDDYAEFRHFKYLLAVAEHKGFRAAAEAINTAQPSLSRQIRDFQEHYNLRLFSRKKGRGIELTPAGEAIRVTAKDLLEARDQALAALESIQRGDAQVLRIGCAPFIDGDVCERATDLQKALLPDATFRASSGDTATFLNSLKHDRLDAIVVSLPINDTDLRVEVIKKERLVVCMPADHGRRRWVEA